MKVGYLIGLILVISLISACAQETAPPAATTPPPAATPTTPAATTPPPATEKPAVTGEEVLLTKDGIEPAELTIAAGSTVTWKNQEDALQVVYDGLQNFRSGNIAKGKTFSYTFEEAGTYVIWSSPYKKKSTVIVE